MGNHSKYDSFYAIQDAVAIHVVKILDIGEQHFRCFCYILRETVDHHFINFYDQPVKSADIGIFIATGLNKDVIKTFPIEVLDSATKCVILPFICYDYGEPEVQQIIFPLVHQLG